MGILVVESDDFYNGVGTNGVNQNKSALKHMVGWIIHANKPLLLARPSVATIFNRPILLNVATLDVGESI